MISDTKYKKCKCPRLYWEVITYDHDEDFRYKSTIHHHCDSCGNDFVVEDFYTGEILYSLSKREFKKSISSFNKKYQKMNQIALALFKKER